MVNNKHIFWQALLATIVIFGIGIILGFFLESFRADKVKINILNSEVDILDEQIRVGIADNFNVSCKISQDSLFSFADRIYFEALKLENYDSASRFDESLRILHKRYDLLRMMLWSESAESRKLCRNSFHTLVYLYEYSSDDLNVKSEQISFSKVLYDFKNNHPNDVLLIPIAANMNLSSVDIAMQNYHIKRLPALIIDEQTILGNLVSSDKLEEIIFNASPQQ